MLYSLTVADKKVTEVAHSRHGEIRDYAWSPRGDFLAFSMNNANGFASVYIWNAADGQSHKLTSDFFNSRRSRLGPAGQLPLLPERARFRARSFPRRNSNYATNRGPGIFALALRKDVKNPFPPESDEVTITKPGDAEKPKRKTSQERRRRPRTLAIDFDGFGSRVTRVPLDGENYAGLTAKSGLPALCS